MPGSHPEREWILIGMAECGAGRGLERTTVDSVCDAAGVGREAFEQEFGDDLDACLDAAMESIVEEGWRRLDEAGVAAEPWPEAVRDGAAILLGLLAERRAFAHLALVEAPAAGGQAQSLHGAARAALVEFLERGDALAGPGVPPSAARGALAGAEALVERTVLAGEAARLPDLVPDVVYMLAVPFTGTEEAQRLQRVPARRRHLRAVA